jgi:hypothetical protein
MLRKVKFNSIGYKVNSIKMMNYSNNKVNELFA